MSAEDPSKGGTSSKSEVSFAERLKQQHAKEHKVTVEDEVDEDDIQHPPPPSAPAESGPAPDHDEVPLSVKAQGKQKAAEVQEDQEVKGQKKQPTLDTKSEELFPALGSGPKGGAAKATWVANKPSGGINGAVTGASVGGPNSHANARPGANGFSAQSRTTAPAVTMPGRTSQRVSFAPSQLLQKDQRKKPFAEVLRDINKRSKAKVEMSHGAAGSIIFEARGPHDDARQALQDVAKEIGSRVSFPCNYACVSAKLVSASG